MKKTGFSLIITGGVAKRSVHPVGEYLASFFFPLRVDEFTASTSVLKPRSRFLRRRLQNLVATAKSSISVFRFKPCLSEKIGYFF
jgi:hypothetical protein